MSTEDSKVDLEVKPEEELKECPCAKRNPHYPYEGMVTKNQCILKPALELVCDKETKEGCALFEAMQENSELRAQIEGWINKSKDFKVP